MPQVAFTLFSERGRAMPHDVSLAAIQDLEHGKPPSEELESAKFSLQINRLPC
jgi:hypothetical protein